MAMSYKARRRWSLAVLLIGLPVYIILALNLAIWLGDMPMLIELAVYLALGVVPAILLRHVFKGVGQADPDAED